MLEFEEVAVTVIAVLGIGFPAESFIRSLICGYGRVALPVESAARYFAVTVGVIDAAVVPVNETVLVPITVPL